jgi:hypothetical protein
MLSRARTWRPAAPWWAIAAVVLAPIIGVLFLRAPVINQIDYIDPWFYSGYGWSLSHGLSVFENTYYGVRFPPILLIAVSSDLFGALGGYLVLHYAILLGTGVALYCCARRFASPRAAAGGVVLLGLDAYYLRLALWDYVTFLQIPAMLAAVAIFPRLKGRWGLVAAAGAGALICAVGISEELGLLVVPPVLLVEFVAVLRRRDGELIQLIVRLIAAVLGGVLLFAVGWFVYWRVAGFSPHDMVAPTIAFARDGTGSAFVHPVSQWIFNEPRIYAPPVFVVGMILIVRRRLLGTDIAARLGQFSVLFVAELWLDRFATNSAIIETWWAYGIAAVPMAFAGVLILDELDRLPRRRTLILIGVVAAAALTDLVIRSFGQHAVGWYADLRGHYLRELVVVILGLGPLLLWSRLRPLARGIAAGSLVVVTTGLALAPAVILGVGQTGEFAASASTEIHAYSLGYTLARYLAGRDTPASRTLVWFPTSQGVFAGTWSNFPSRGGSLNDYLSPAPLTQLTPTALSRLAEPTTARVLVLTGQPSGLVQAKATLRRAGYTVHAGAPGTWDGVSHQLLQIRALPAGDNVQAVRVMTEGLLRDWRGRQAQDLCDLTYPPLAAVIADVHQTCPAGVRAALRADPRPPTGIVSISVSRDTARVRLADDPTPLVYDRAFSEWGVFSGAPWIP